MPSLCSFIVLADLVFNFMFFADLISIKENATYSCEATGDPYLPACAPEANPDALQVSKIFLSLTTLSLIAMVASTALCCYKNQNNRFFDFAILFFPETFAALWIILNANFIFPSGSLSGLCHEVDMVVALKSVMLSLTYIGLILKLIFAA